MPLMASHLTPKLVNQSSQLIFTQVLKASEPRQGG